jgi:hypothetical protein
VPIIIFPLYLPAFVLLIFWILFQVASAAAGGPVGGGVAWWEHIGGFVAGALLAIPFRHKTVPLFGGGKLPQGIRLRRGGPRRHGGSEGGPDRDGPDKGPWG